VDDGLRAGLLDVAALREVPIFGRHLQEVERHYPNLPARRQAQEVVRRMINSIVVDLIETSAGLLRDAAPSDIEAVRAHGQPLIMMSAAMRTEVLELKGFLRDHLYRHYRVQRMTRKARAVVTDLFQSFMEDLLLMPDEHRAAAGRLESEQGAAGRARAVADYVAGMTDRYAIREHERIFVPAQRS
jgi:dGTPase